MSVWDIVGIGAVVWMFVSLGLILHWSATPKKNALRRFATRGSQLPVACSSPGKWADCGQCRHLAGHALAESCLSNCISDSIAPDGHHCVPRDVVVILKERSLS